IDAVLLLVVHLIGMSMLSHTAPRSAKPRVPPLRRPPGPPRQVVIERMIDSFRKRHGLTAGSVTAAELARAEELVRTKFATEEWTARVP
ncbi:lipoate--protein ligase family protein, partial [Streptomyces bacillaris]